MKNPHRYLVFVAAVAALLSFSACSQVSYKGPNGVEFSSTRIGSKLSVGKLSANAHTGEVKLEGYSNDQTETAAAVAGAVAAALSPTK